MKPLLAFFFLLLLHPGTALQAEDTPKSASTPAAVPSQASQRLLDLCPKDMPPACACVVQGDGVRVMPATEAHKSGKTVLLVGPQT